MLPINTDGWGLFVADHVDAMLGYWDKDLVCRFANNAYASLYGKTRDEVVNKMTMRELLGDTFFEKNLSCIEQVLLGQQQQFEREIHTRSGEVRYTIANYFPDISGIEVRGFFVHVADITQQHLADIAASKSNERNRIFVQQAPHAIAMFDKDMRYLSASGKWVSDYRLQDKEIIGKSHYDIFPEIGEDWKKIHRECLKGAINQCDEAMFERADGSVQWITWDVRPWYESGDTIGGLLMYTADITPIKERDAERRKTQQILEKSNQVARIATWEINVATSETTWNPIANEIFELPPGPAPAYTDVLKFYRKGEHLNRLLAAIKELTENGTPYDLEAEIITPKGNNRWIRIIGEAEFKNGVCIRRYGIFQDITRVKESKARLYQLNEELEAVLNSGHVSIIGTDINGIITHFNHGAERLLGYSAKEMIGIHTPMLIHEISEITSRGEELTKQTGHPVTGFDIFIETVKTEKYESRQWTYKKKNGTHFPVQLVVTAMKDKDGNITGYLGVATDISELKEAEKETKALLEISTEQNERLKNFARIVSHNLRSHSANIEMLIRLYSESSPEVAESEYVDLLGKASDNLKETITDLNEIAMVNLSTVGKLTEVNLYQKIESTIFSVFQLAKDAQVTITNEVDKAVCVAGLPAYIDSILLNFITNGIKYRSEGRPAYLKLSTVKENEFVVLHIEDNGRGIDLDKYGAKLFGLYKTFHGNEDSRGVGLFITKNQVEAMGGKIEVSSQPGKGTTFRIYLKNIDHPAPDAVTQLQLLD